MKYIRNQVFAVRWEFESFEEAQEYLQERLAETAAGSDIEAERRCLLPYRPPPGIARMTEATVDKYSFVRLENNSYSVPDHLVGKRLRAKIYPAEVIIYAGQAEVARHQRLRGYQGYSVDIPPCLDTLARKPGAVKDSVALKSRARLKAVFDEHYQSRPREFVALLKEPGGLPIDEAAGLIEERATSNIVSFTRPVDTIAENVAAHTRRQMAELTEAFLGGGDRVG